MLKQAESTMKENKSAARNLFFSSQIVFAHHRWVNVFDLLTQEDNQLVS